MLTTCQACQHFQRLRGDKLVWIAALSRTQETRALACPIGTDISTLEIPQLIDIAIKTHRIATNWASDSPRLAGPTKSLRYTPTSLHSAPVSTLSVIPGTSLVLIYVQRDDGEWQEVKLCDTSTSRTSVSYAVLPGRFVGHAYHDAPGQRTVAAVTQGGYVKQ
jgi:hypothetical protein